MGTALNPEAPQAVEGDTPLPEMPSYDQIVASLEREVEDSTSRIEEATAERKRLQGVINEQRVRRDKAARLLKATKPRGSKGG